MNTNEHQRTPTNTYGHRRTPTDTDKHRRTPKNTDEHLQTSIASIKCAPSKSNVPPPMGAMEGKIIQLGSRGSPLSRQNRWVTQRFLKSKNFFKNCFCSGKGTIALSWTIGPLNQKSSLWPKSKINPIFCISGSQKRWGWRGQAKTTFFSFTAFLDFSLTQAIDLTCNKNQIELKGDQRGPWPAKKGPNFCPAAAINKFYTGWFF